MAKVRTIKIGLNTYEIDLPEVATFSTTGIFKIINYQEVNATNWKTIDDAVLTGKALDWLVSNNHLGIPEAKIPGISSVSYVNGVLTISG